MEPEYLLEARGLQKYFPIRGGLMRKEAGSVKAVDLVDIPIAKGETIGLVGESGCGKTTTGRCMLLLTKPTGGHIYYKMPGEHRKELLELEKVEAALLEKDAKQRTDRVPELSRLRDLRIRYALDQKDPEALRHLRKEMQIVFQDPYSSLNPRMLIKDIVGEPIHIHGVASGPQLLDRVSSILEKVGLTKEHMYRYPHEFSGGQRQRIGVARALVLNPDMVVLDEPTSALDVSVQAQILNMLNDLQSELGLTYLFISHDLSTVRYMCDRVNVMYLGKVVESAQKEDLFHRPLHPYTEALLSVIPIPDPEIKKNPIVLSGEVPSPAHPPSGCRFHTRCRHREAICEQIEPPLVDKGQGHFVSCHFR